MTGVLAGSGGTGVLEGSRPGTGVEGGGGVSAYDAAILTMGPMWYSTVSSTAPILFWPTLAEVRDGDLGDEIERGRLWFAAWWNESGNAPVTYIATADDFGPALMWYSPVDEFDPIVWPTLIEVLDGDLAAVKGTGWFAAWFADSGYAPATYELDIAETGPMWFSRLAELDAIVSWPTLDAVITGDLGSESENGRQWMAAWFSDSGNAPATYDLDVNETGPIWYSTIDELNAIATWPTLATVITGDLGAESENGHWWFAAWFLEAGQAPATYRGDIDETGPMWFSPLDALVPTLTEAISALSPVMHLKLDDASAPVVNSGSAGGTVAVTGTSPTFQDVAGPDGVSYPTFADGFFDVPNDAKYSIGANGVTLAIAFRPTVQDSIHVLLSKRGSAFGDREYWIATPGVGVAPYVQVYQNDSQSVYAQKTIKASSFVLNKWQFLVVRISSTGAISTFYNSATENSTASTGPTGTVETSRAINLGVGGGPLAAWGFEGQLAHAAAFDGALTDGQIETLVNTASAEGWMEA